MQRRNHVRETPPTLPADDSQNEIDVKLDKMNKLWMKLEAKLLKEQPPRRIACRYRGERGEDEYGEYRYDHYLGVQRDHGKWRICYGTDVNRGGESDLDSISWKPITECDLDTRIDAAKGLDELKAEVANTTIFFIPALESAIDGLEKALLDDEE